MGYIGNNSTVQNFTPTVDYFNGNGSTTSFTLSRSVGSVFDIQAFIENVPQNPSTAFTVAGNVIRFDSAPPSGTNNIYVRYTSPVTQLVKPAPGTVGTTEISSSVTLTTPLISGNLNFDSTGTSGIRLPSANTLAFHTTGTEDMRIDSAGRVGIGTTSPYLPLNVNGTNSNAPTLGTASGSMLVANADRTYGVMHGVSGSGWGWIQTQRVDASAMAYDLILQPSGGNVGIGTTGPSSNLTIQRASAASSFGMRHTAGGNGYGYVFATTGTTTNDLTISSEFNGSPTERMRIDSEGYFLMAPTYRTVPRGRVDISAPGNSVGGLPTVCLAMSRWGDAGPMVNFFSTHESTTSIGNITNQGGTNTQYNTSSDYRLKENIAPMTGALAKVTLLKPCTYTWKSTGDDGQGFIAHELQEVFPDAVYGEKDAVDTEGNVVSQGVDTSYLVATLTAAIQEQQAIIEDLKARIEVLEAK